MNRLQVLGQELGSISMRLATSDRTLQERFDQSKVAYLEDVAALLTQHLQSTGWYDVKVNGGKTKYLRVTPASQVTMFQRGARPTVSFTVTLMWFGSDAMDVKVVTDTPQTSSTMVDALGVSPSKAVSQIVAHPFHGLCV